MHFIWISLLLVMLAGYLFLERKKLPRIIEHDYFLLATITLSIICGYFEWLIAGYLSCLPVAVLLGSSVSLNQSGGSLVENRVTSPINKSVFRISFLSVLLLGFAVRIYNLDTFSLTIDEHWHLNTAVGYLQTGSFRQWNFVTKTPGDYYPHYLPFTWLVIESFRWGNVNLWWGRLPSLIAGMVIIFPYLWLCRRLQLDRFLQLIALALLMFTPYMISSSRWIRMYAWFTVLYCTCVGTTYKFIKAKSRLRTVLWCFVTVFIILLTALFHRWPTVLLVFSLVIYFLSEWITKHIKLQQKNKISVLGRFIVSVIGLVILILIASSTLTVLDLFRWKEIELPSWQNLYYFIYLLNPYVEFLFAGIGLGAILLTVNKRPIERLILVSWLVPLSVSLFSSRFPPENRYIGYLYPLFLPCLILGTDRVLRQAFDKRKVYIATLILLMVLVPFSGVPANLQKIWKGDPVGLSYPSRTGKPHAKTLSKLEEKISGDDYVLIYDIPSYHASNFMENVQTEVHYLSSFQESLTRDHLEKVLKYKKRTVWIVIANWYRPDLNDAVKKLLREEFTRVPSLSGEWMRVYKHVKITKGSEPQ